MAIFKMSFLGNLRGVANFIVPNELEALFWQVWNVLAGMQEPAVLDEQGTL